MKYIPEIWSEECLSLLKSQCLFSNYYVRRTLPERLFTLPWKPLKKYKVRKIDETTHLSNVRVD